MKSYTFEVKITLSPAASFNPPAFMRAEIKQAIERAIQHAMGNDIDGAEVLNPDDVRQVIVK